MIRDKAALFVKIRKNRTSPLKIGDTQDVSVSVTPKVISYSYTCLPQLRSDIRIISILSLVHNYFLVILLTYSLIRTSCMIRNIEEVVTSDTVSELGLIFASVNRLSNGYKALVFAGMYVMLILFLCHFWTTYRLYKSTDQTNTKRESYKLSQPWIPLNLLLNVCSFIGMTILFIQSHLQLAMLANLSVAVRTVSLVVATKYILELKKKDTPVLVPSEYIRMPVSNLMEMTQMLPDNVQENIRERGNKAV